MQLKHREIVKRWASSSSFDWNSKIKACVDNGLFSESLGIYSSMLHSGLYIGDNFTFPLLLKACSKLSSLWDGQIIHAHALLSGFQSHVHVQTSLLNMYSKCSATSSSSRRLFDEMPLPTLVSWNAIISVYCTRNHSHESFLLFRRMRLLGFHPNSSTLVSLLSACKSGLLRGSSIHCHGIKLGLTCDLILLNSIITLYLHFHQLDAARNLFNSMDQRSIVTWTALIGGYVYAGDVAQAFNLFNQMRHQLLTFDSVVFINLISGCARAAILLIASSVHAQTVKMGFDHKDSIQNSLVNMYTKCGDPISARRIFDYVNEKSVLLWTSMISGYAQFGNPGEALKLFKQLSETSTKPNRVTFATVLSACADLGSLALGEEIEEYVRLSGLELDLQIQTSLIHMYCKCGSIERAKGIFDRALDKDLAMWSSMLNGYAIHGMGEEALNLFHNLKRQENFKPDAVVFMGVLSACSHSGLVEDGLKYFQSMQRDFGIKPSTEHYSALVDLLGRAGYLKLALKTIQEMPVQAQTQVWVPLLSACRAHRNVQLGEFVAKKLVDVAPQNMNNYILMANIYASVGKWKEAARLRSLMEGRGLVKEPAWSRIEVDGYLHVFLVGDRSHHRSVEIYEKLEELNAKLREVGYVAETQMVIQDLEQEDKEDALGVHSERLAVAFGLLSTEPDSPLRIMKNLRTCTDCHTALKFISKITNRHLIVRDGNRFHHFKSGSCSCKDFW
ncbi:Pentatricopeptide repeat [Thalictrum thalictroides]|uniref:Pentatricopeptide repeat n=1 Tax=Thalictrum thalictroides TaxID=46969 RepID=A0A7J6V5Q0_THATH|nr:Pentatricopeptide repeat [Thalictrum thalictroides]